MSNRFFKLVKKSYGFKDTKVAIWFQNSINLAKSVGWEAKRILS